MSKQAEIWVSRRNNYKKSKAEKKYNKYTKEGARRIAQSHGYKFSIMDMPDMIKLLERGGILLDGVDYDTMNQTTQFSDTSKIMNYDQLPDTETIKF